MDRLRELRIMNGYSQDDVASHLQITRAAYTNIENHKRQPSADTLLSLSNFYGVTVGCLLGVEPISSSKEKQPIAQGNELDNELVSMLVDLSPAEILRVRDFVEGLKAARKAPPSQNP